MLNVVKTNKSELPDNIVYDISLDGTVVNALGMNIISNTDGFNFQLPPNDKFRYTEENPYIGKGLNREVKEGKAYTGFEADVAEFNDIFMSRVYNEKSVQKMGLGIDEVMPEQIPVKVEKIVDGEKVVETKIYNGSCIQFARKNYADYFPDNPYPKDVKLVGNTVKSKKMPEYIAKFLSIGIRLLLRGEGQDFINEYYTYVEQIYNFKIPLRDIATKGKIKKSLQQYLKDIKEVTKAGRPKSRQAWYELALKENLDVNNGDTIYYINTGKSKSHADVKKVTHYMDSDGNEVTKEIEKALKIYNKENKNNANKMDKKAWLEANYPNVTIKEEIILNCKLVPREIIDSENDVFCNEDLEYNTAKYIDMFNKRITPLLVCFSKEIRSDILISNPKDRKYFTVEQCQLVSGEPNKVGDQDTYEQLMTMEDKEIKFWTTYNMIPPFIEECHMGKWEDIVKDYNYRMERDKQLGIDKDKETFVQIVQNMDDKDIETFLENGEVPAAILKIADLNPQTLKFMSNKYPDIEIGSITDIVEIIEAGEFANNNTIEAEE